MLFGFQDRKISSEIFKTLFFTFTICLKIKFFANPNFKDIKISLIFFFKYLQISSQTIDLSNDYKCLLNEIRENHIFMFENQTKLE